MLEGPGSMIVLLRWPKGELQKGAPRCFIALDVLVGEVLAEPFKQNSST